jgi:hypothetical protein
VLPVFTVIDFKLIFYGGMSNIEMFQACIFMKHPVAFSSRRENFHWILDN